MRLDASSMEFFFPRSSLRIEIPFGSYSLNIAKPWAGTLDTLKVSLLSFPSSAWVHRSRMVTFLSAAQGKALPDHLSKSAQLNVMLAALVVRLNKATARAL